MKVELFMYMLSATSEYFAHQNESASWMQQLSLEWYCLNMIIPDSSYKKRYQQESLIKMQPIITHRV